MEQSSVTHSNRTESGRGAESIADLLRRLLDDASTLIHKELALVKTEVSEALSEAKVAAISMATGGAVLFAGILVLLAAAVLGLAHVVADWMAALIVGGIVAIIGFVMIQGGKKKLEPSAFKPDRTQNALRRDKEMMQRRMP